MHSARRGLGSDVAGSRPYLPPYCFGAPCAVVPILQAQTAVRLDGAEQAMLNVSNQVDTTQVNTTFFGSTAAWIDAARACEARLYEGRAMLRRRERDRGADFLAAVATDCDDPTVRAAARYHAALARLVG